VLLDILSLAEFDIGLEQDLQALLEKVPYIRDPLPTWREATGTQYPLQFQIGALYVQEKAVILRWMETVEKGTRFKDAAARCTAKPERIVT